MQCYFLPWVLKVHFNLILCSSKIDTWLSIIRKCPSNYEDFKLPHPPKEKAPFSLDAVVKSFRRLKSILLKGVYFLHLRNLQIIFIF